MRRSLLVTCLLGALLVPSAALAARLAPGDGTLSVKNGDGRLSLNLHRGAVIGRIGEGMLEIRSREEQDCSSFDVSGAERKRDVTPDVIVGVVCRYWGEAIRFKLLQGPVTIRILGPGLTDATNFSLSAVGRGRGQIVGSGGFDGTYSVNGEDYASLPEAGETIVLGTLGP